jgi:hypothetical protein
VADPCADARPNLRKDRHRRYSKDQLDHEHFGELRRSGAVLNMRDLAIALVTDHVSQFSLSQTETAPKNPHQVSIAWCLIPQVRAWLCRFSFTIPKIVKGQ